MNVKKEKNTRARYKNVCFFVLLSYFFSPQYGSKSSTTNKHEQTVRIDKREEFSS